MITVRRASVVVALVAALATASALRNGFAADDVPIVERNPTAHSVNSALASFDQAYWPPEYGSGLYRPLVILSFGLDWQVSGGNAHWLHAVNIGWHAAASALLVPVLAAYVGPAAALAGGVVFAVHPVHVEAVANIVGRAELMAAAFLFAALLLARAVRRRLRTGAGTLPLEVAVLGAVALALLSKEHAVIAIALLALDDVATRESLGPRLPWRTYAGVLVLTAVWFFGRRAVEGGLSFAAVAPTFFNLGTVGRLSTMLPVVLVLLRLLVWPFDLSPDYHPQVIPRLEHMTAQGVVGALLLAALAALAFLLWRRQRATSVGLFVIGIAWLPTANLLFPSGVVIAERTLYLPSAGVALLAAVGAAAIARRWGARRATIATLIVVVAFGVRTATATATWRSNRTFILAAFASHPESYRAHLYAARVLARRGMLREALAEYGVSIQLYPGDHPSLMEAAGAAIDAGQPAVAARYLHLALRALRLQERLDPAHAPTQRMLAVALLQLDSAAAALPHARRAVAGAPRDRESARVLATSFLALHAPDSARAVWAAFLRRGGSPFWGWFLRSSTFAAIGMLDSARLSFDSARARAFPDSSTQAELRTLFDAIGRAVPPSRPPR